MVEKNEEEKEEEHLPLLYLYPVPRRLIWISCLIPWVRRHRVIFPCSVASVSIIGSVS